MIDFGISDYLEFRQELWAKYPQHRIIERGYRYVVEFRDGSMGVVLTDGTFKGDDAVWSNGPRN